MDRTERQLEGIKRWVKAGGHGTLVYGTGVGKSWTEIMLIERMCKRKSDLDVIIVVPTQILKDQWMNDYLIPRNLVRNCHVAVVNSAVKEMAECDLLVIDKNLSM